MLGASYQLKTNMDDWTGTGEMRIVNQQGQSIENGRFLGDYTVKDFQFPAVATIGLAFKPNRQWLLAADISQIQWSNVMSKFRLNFSTQTPQGTADADIELNQDWDNQTVIKLGAAYTVNNNLTLRFGTNIADNPVPKEFVNPLFPAIIKTHYTAGASYSLSKQHAISGSFVYAPKVTQTNSNTQVKSSHSQSNLQFMYSFNF
jgi:long-chain fatty acid transport protein